MPTIVKLSHWKPGYYCPEKHCYMSKINYEHCYMSKILKFRPIFSEHFLHLVWHWIFNRLTSSVESSPSNFYSHLFSKYVFCAFHDRSLHLCQWPALQLSLFLQLLQLYYAFLFLRICICFSCCCRRISQIHFPFSYGDFSPFSNTHTLYVHKWAFLIFPHSMIHV